MATAPAWVVPVLLRASLGGVALFHGLRLLGAFTSDSAQTKVAELAQKVGLAGFSEPTVMAWLAVVGMCLGGVGMVLGAFTRVAAGVLAAVCLLGLAIRPPVWEVNGISDLDRLSIEFLLVLLVQCGAVFCTGAGRFSVDDHLEQRRKS